MNLVNVENSIDTDTFSLEDNETINTKEKNYEKYFYLY